MEATFRTARDGIVACLARITALAAALEECRGTVMGLEGTAGRVYCDCLSRLPPEAYKFDGRSRHPARDGFNAMLNYAYGVLYGHVEKACILAGLDRCAGFLHTNNYGKRSLVYDLIEPFRILADRAVVLLFTGRRAQAGYFESVPGGVGLTKDGRAALLTTLNQRLEKAVWYPVRGRPGKFRNLKQRDVIRHEAHALANALLGKNQPLTVVETRSLWAEDAAPPPAEDEPAAEEPTVPVVDCGPADADAAAEEPPC
jgi:CRISP-associated protein Cas1